MDRKTVLVHLRHLTLALTFLWGTFPILSSNMSSMPMRYMDHNMGMEMEDPQIDIAIGNIHETSSHPCCDLICPFSTFLTSQLVYAIPYGDKEQIVSTVLITRPIYIKAIVPPPKA